MPRQELPLPPAPYSRSWGLLEEETPSTTQERKLPRKFVEKFGGSWGKGRGVVNGWVRVYSTYCVVAVQVHGEKGRQGGFEACAERFVTADASNWAGKGEYPQTS